MKSKSLDILIGIFIILCVVIIGYLHTINVELKKLTVEGNICSDRSITNKIQYIYDTLDTSASCIPK